MPPRVLVLEDDKELREVVIDALGLMGADVISTASGIEAVALFREHPDIDLVLLDIGVPDLCGWVVAEMIRKRSSAVPIYLVTGWAFQAGWQHSKRQLVDGIYVKPVSINVLEELLEKCGGVS